MYTLLGNGKEWLSIVYLFSPIPCLLIVFDASSVELFVSQTVECQEKMLYISHFELM